MKHGCFKMALASVKRWPRIIYLLTSVVEGKLKVLLTLVQASKVHHLRMRLEMWLAIYQAQVELAHNNTTNKVFSTAA